MREGICHNVRYKAGENPGAYETYIYICVKGTEDGRVYMDQIKIGRFIAEMRKEQNLTQQDLAEKLGISNKTISKWECGNGMPDYAVMESLCEILKINVNELLSGERLPSQEYSKKAEENMISLIQEHSENSKRDMREWLKFMIGIVVLAFFVWLTIIMWGGAPAVQYFIDGPSILYVLIMTVIVLIISGNWKDFRKAFPLAMKKIASTEIRQVKKSLLAVKTAMVTINAVGVMAFVIGIVIICGKLTDLATLGPNLVVAMLSVMYGLVVTLLLIPIYTRLKTKLVEE